MQVELEVEAQELARFGAHRVTVSRGELSRAHGKNERRSCAALADFNKARESRAGEALSCVSILELLSLRCLLA